MKDDHDRQLRQHLLDLLKGGNAHASFEDVVNDFPVKLAGQKPAGQPHSAWRLLEHLRIAQWDILEFSRNARHKSPKWPQGYWPKEDAPADEAAWQQSVNGFKSNLKAIETLVSDPKTDLYAKISWGEGQTILREVLLVADHNAYHVGELLMIRRLLGAWNK